MHGGRVSSEVFEHTSVLRFAETWTAALGRPAACPNTSNHCAPSVSG